MKYLGLLSALLFICTAPAAAQTCTYAFNQSAGNSPVLTWKGYKFTEKTGVPGTFKKIDWQQNTKAKSMADLISSIKFSIDASSVNTKDPARDITLKAKFFGEIKDNGKVTGKGKSYDAKAKKAVATITFNGVEQDVSFDVATKDDQVTFSSAIDIIKHFKMDAAYKSIAEACKPLHTGKDGKAVTWSEVGLEVKADVVKTCN